MVGVVRGNFLKALFWPPRPLLLVPLLALIGSIAGLIHWYRFEIETAYTSLLDRLIGVLGLSIVPLALWSAAFVLAVMWYRGWLRRINVWAGLLMLISAAAGFFSFHEPATGLMAIFTLNGEVSLGGSFGETVSGSTTITGALRVAGITVLAAVVAFPKLTRDFVALIYGVSRSLYILLALTVRGFLRMLTGIYRFQPQTPSNPIHHDQIRPASPPDQKVTGSVASSRSGGEMTGRRAVSNIPTASVPSDNTARDPSLTETLGANDASEADLSGEVSVAEWPDYNLELNEPPLAKESLDDKSNRFWKNSENEDPDVGVNASEMSGGIDGTEDRGQTTNEPWMMPPRTILVDAVEGEISETKMADTAETIRRTLVEYGVEVESGEIKPGPAVTMYGLIPGWVRRYKQTKVLDEKGIPRLDESGKASMTRIETKTRVKVDSILSREKDLALALRTPSIRIETPVMGKSMIGIEVPNPEPALVTLGNVMHRKEFNRLREIAHLPMALGKASGGETVMVDLAKMPHLLVAGATGSGKSVFINTIVACLLMEKSPAEMRLLLVDPKRVELTPYNGVPHLLTPVVVETDKVVGLLKGLIQEMFSRYRKMEEVGVRNIDGYNTKMSEKMPYIVIAVDELADLMMTAAFDVERSLCRLAQLGRATGIHLVVATQRPSVDVVTGLIKANFPSRVSFGVTSQIDSRTILDTAGAEKLLGRGDMLYLSQDASRPERVQGLFISDPEIEKLVAFWRASSRRLIPHIELRVTTSDDTDENVGTVDVKDSTDELIDKALEVAQHYNKLSTSLLQRRLRIGYPRAARLMDQLEEQGIVGPGDGSKSRDVINNQV